MILTRIEITDASKRFGATQALAGVDLTLEPGRVHALVGANGCGKSTIVKILAGYHRADSGAITIDSESYALADLAGGVAPWPVGVVHQDLGLLDELTLLENFLLPELAHSGSGHIRWKALGVAVRERLARFGVTADLSGKARHASRVTRALLALARAVWVLEGTPDLLAGEDEGDRSDVRTGTLILDEITAFMSRREVDLLHDVVRRVVAEGHGVLLVSHDLDEILAFADHLTVLRNGTVAAEVDSSDVDKKALFRLISGAEVVKPAEHPIDAAIVREKHVSVEVRSASNGDVGPVSFEVAAGEVVGLAGLIGSGFEEVPYAIFGTDRQASGNITIGTDRYDLSGLTTSAAIAAGIALVPADRNQLGLWRTMTIAENLFPMKQSFRASLALSWREIWRNGDRAISAFGVKAPNSKTLVEQLSGGNAQKVLIAKWLNANPRLLVLHEPVQGVDVGARAQIAELILNRASKGMAVICASSDQEYLSEVAHRVLIFDRGRIVHELKPEPGAQFVSKDAIVWASQDRQIADKEAAHDTNN